jgi:hypothetical protein
MNDEKVIKYIKELEAELVQWKANHADVVKKYRDQREKYGEALLMIRLLERKLDETQ